MPSQRPPFLRRFRPARRPGRQQVAQRAMRSQTCGRDPREVGITELIRGCRVPSRCNMRHQHIKCDHKQQSLAASRREKQSTEGLQQHPERMTPVCAVSIMNTCLHELVWVLRVSRKPCPRCRYLSTFLERQCRADISLVKANVANIATFQLFIEANVIFRCRDIYT